MPWANGGAEGRTMAQVEDAVVNEFAGGVVGSGDAQQMYNATTAQLLAVKDGTAAAPDTTLGPLIKVERTIEIAQAAIGGDGVEQLSSLVGITVGTAACEVQPVGVGGFASTSSTVSSPGNDACGLYGVGRVNGSGTGAGIGLFAACRTESAAGKGTGAEIAVYNGSGSAHSVNPTGYPSTVGLWMNSTGTSRAGVGIVLANSFSRQFDVGLHFNGQVTGGLTGPTVTADIQSNSTATTSIKIAGTHTSAIQVDEGAGKVLIGKTAETFASSRFEVQKSSSSDPIADFRVTTGACTLTWATASGNGKIFATSGADQFLTGTASGDVGVQNPQAGKSFHIGGTVSTIEVTNGNALGFFNVTTPVTKQTVTGAKGSNAALASLLTALAAYGLVTDSSTA